MEKRVRQISVNEAQLPEHVAQQVGPVGSRPCADDEDDRDLMVWNPKCKLTEEEINEYLEGAASRNVPVEKAHEVLSFFNYDVRRALEFCTDFVVPDLFSDAEKFVLWNTVKIEHFRASRTHQRFFPLKRLLSRQTYGSFNEYYYKNKPHDFVYVPRLRSAVKKVDVNVVENEHICPLKLDQYRKRKRNSLPNRKRKSMPKLSRRKIKRQSL